MKILFAIQGTGNGHLSRARDVYPELAKHGDVDVLVSGIQADIALPYPVKYRHWGMSFIFGRAGGVDIWQTANKLRLRRLLRDIKSLPVEQYDLIINDFEPVSAWACRLKHKPCISLSHQCAVLNPHAPAPDTIDLVGKLVLERYAPTTAAYGFHFKAYDDNIFTPVIRKEIRALQPTDRGHYTVYLPAYDDNTLFRHLSQFPEVQWKVFSKHNHAPYTLRNVRIMPIDNKAFINSMAESTGVLCGAGFEGPAEALYLGKKLMVIPMQTQYEQHCNAAALKAIGVPVIKALSAKYYSDIRNWLHSDERIMVDYPDITEAIVSSIVHAHTQASHSLQAH
jgi:uncharacterized protein (TIGR00661 family)